MGIRDIASRVGAAFMMTCLSACQAGGDDGKAVAALSSSGTDSEYTTRWLTSPIAGSEQAPGTAVAVGPSLQEVLDVLRAPAKGKPKVVTYYSAKPGTSLPPGIDVILRKRATDKKTEFTYKIRSESVPAAAPPVPECDGSRPTTPEFDITLSGPTETVWKWSMSCTFEVEDKATPPQWMEGATERPCPITMTRYEATSPSDPSEGKARPLKVEEWHFGTYATLVEVSWKASDAATDEQSFRNAVGPVLKLTTSKGGDLLAKPAPSKERLAQDCDAFMLTQKH